MKKKLIIISIIALILYVGTASFSLVKTGERSTVNYPLSKELKERIVNETHELDEIDILNYSLKLTDELLEFDETNNIKDGKANCVGYALLCANIMNYGLTHIAAKAYVTPCFSGCGFFGGDFGCTCDFTFPMGFGLISSSS